MELTTEELDTLVEYFKLLIEIEQELTADGVTLDYLEDDGE